MRLSLSFRTAFIGATTLAALMSSSPSSALDAENDELGVAVVGPSHAVVSHLPTATERLEFKLLPDSPESGPLTVAIDGEQAAADLDLADGIDGDEVSTAQEVADPAVWCALDAFDFGSQPGPVDELIFRACTE